MRIARELGRLLDGPGRSAAPRHGQEDRRPRWPCIARASSRAPARSGILPAIAEQIFEQAAKFAGYGFNKGHAAAYAQVAYQTAYLKANYPVEFLAASMTLDIGNTDRLNVFRQEAQRLGVKVAAAGHQPLRGRLRLRCRARASIFYALAAVKGVGRQAMDHVVAERNAERAVPQPRRFRAPHRSQARQQARLRKPGPGRRLRLLSTAIAARLWNSPTSCSAAPQRNARERESGQAIAVRRRRRDAGGTAAGASRRLAGA